MRRMAARLCPFGAGKAARRRAARRETAASRRHDWLAHDGDGLYDGWHDGHREIVWRGCAVSGACIRGFGAHARALARLGSCRHEPDGWCDTRRDPEVWNVIFEHAPLDSLRLAVAIGCPDVSVSERLASGGWVDIDDGSMPRHAARYLQALAAAQTGAPPGERRAAVEAVARALAARIAGRGEVDCRATFRRAARACDRGAIQRGIAPMLVELWLSKSDVRSPDGSRWLIAWAGLTDAEVRDECLRCWPQQLDAGPKRLARIFLRGVVRPDSRVISEVNALVAEERDAYRQARAAHVPPGQLEPAAPERRYNSWHRTATTLRQIYEGRVVVRC